MSIEKHAQWIKERNDAVLSMDLKKFKAFIKKWQAEGLYTMPVPDNDMILSITMHQMVLAIEDAPEGKKILARLWLIDHGCNPYPWG